MSKIQCKDYRILSKIKSVLKSGYCKSLLGYENAVWFVNELLKLEIQMNFCFKNTKKDIIMTQEDKEDFEKKNICRFCEKKVEPDKVKDHCHLSGNYRVPDHSKCNINGKQKDSVFISIIFHSFMIVTSSPRNYLIKRVKE